MSNVIWYGNKWSRVYWLSLQLNIWIKNSINGNSSSSSTSNVLSYCLNSLNLPGNSPYWSCFFDWINFISPSLLNSNYNWQYETSKPKETRKVIFELLFTLYFTKLFNAVSTIFKQAIYFWDPSSIFLSLALLLFKRKLLVNISRQNHASFITFTNNQQKFHSHTTWVLHMLWIHL